MGVINLSGFVCERCSHTWFPRRKKFVPFVCPHCKSPYWNIPRRKVRRQNE